MLTSSIRRRRRIAVPIALMAVLTMAAACGDDDDDGAGSGGTAATSGATSAGTSGGADSVTVTAANFAFDPTDLTVSAGGTITLRNEDDTEHSFTIDDPKVETEAEGGEEGTATAPEEAGTYNFYCKYHPTQMKGTLTVQG
jgi:plastocyanin